ncbi:iron-containing alcohol dehydrogenase [Streptomyces sp. NPDC055722]
MSFPTDRRPAADQQPPAEPVTGQLPSTTASAGAGSGFAGSIRPGQLPLLPTRRVVWGAGTAGRLQELLEELGACRVLLLTTASLVRQQVLLERVRAACGPLLVGTISDLAAHVPQAGVRAGAQRCRELKVDGIVSFGGGSVIDAGKAIAAELIDEGAGAPVHIALPTTLSGAELSHFYGVSEERPEGPFKQSYARADVTPAMVVFDPELTVATPVQLWSSSGIKALDHAIEGLLAGLPGPVAGSLARLGIRHMADALLGSLDAQALDHRLACQIAAWECYVAPGALSHGLSHRIGHVLGGTYHVPHSLTSAVTLAPVMRAMREKAPEALAEVARALDVDAALDLSRPAAADPLDAPARLEELIRSAELPSRLREVGIARTQLPEIAATVRAAYPRAVAQLGDDGAARLDALLGDMW